MLCEHLQGLGVDARMIEEEGDHVTLTGQEIDVVKVSYYGRSDISAAHYDVDYGLKCNVDKVEKKVKAQTKFQTKGFIRGKIVDFKWVGGELADELNKDDALKKQLLKQLKGKGYSKSYEISIFPDKKAGIVWITTTKYMPPFPMSVKPFEVPEDLMPSETSFKLYNAIAKHMRNIASPQSD